MVREVRPLYMSIDYPLFITVFSVIHAFLPFGLGMRAHAQSAKADSGRKATFYLNFIG
jgi:hypothetical protein